jgi:hypothetical protein
MFDGRMGHQLGFKYDAHTLFLEFIPGFSGVMR